MIEIRESRTGKIKIAFFGMFPSDKCKNDPNAIPYSKEYRCYDRGPRYLVLTVLGVLSKMYNDSATSKLAGAPFRGKVIAFIAHLTKHHRCYFEALDNVLIHEHTLVDDVLKPMLNAFNTFIRMFHGIVGYQLTYIQLANTYTQQVDPASRVLKLNNPSLLLFLPASCMDPRAPRNVDASYQHPAQCELHMVEIKEA